jgi:hypothetical protein
MTPFPRGPVILCSCVLLASALFLRGQSFKSPSGLVYMSFPGEPTPSRGLLNTLFLQARWDSPQTDEHNPDGLRLRFVRTEGQGAQGTASAGFRVFAEGAPVNKVYGLTFWEIGQEETIDPRDLYINDQGLVMTHRPLPEQEGALAAPGDELELAPQAGTAEPVRYMLSSKDDALSIFGTLVPHPLVAQDQGCALELRIAQPHATAVLLVAEGFPPDARIPLILESEGQTIHMTMDTNSSGHAELADFPSVPGKVQGSLRATAEGPSCLPSAVLPWGAQPVQKAR